MMGFVPMPCPNTRPMVTTSEIREQFLSYFAEQGHTRVPSGSLVPDNDKTLLFTNAGMVQFKDLFTGEDSRDYVRATSSQRCVRAGGKHNDLDNVGYTARHHTFFEMLGNFSFGDYFKAEAIAFAWEFLTDRLALPKDKLWVTVFEEDDEAERIWVEDIGVPKERVIRIGAKDNFWAMGDTGPCGPCSEIFYDHGPEVEGGPPGSPDEDGDRYIEIWNLVFMQFERSADGVLNPLPAPCVDTGMGLERIAAVLQHVHSNYEIDLFSRLISDVAKAVGVVDTTSPSLRVIADHIRSCAFLVVDGVQPGNEGPGYVLRRIIRRAARHGNKLGANGAFFHTLVKPLVREMGEAFPELAKAEERVADALRLEEERFALTLSSGMKILEEEVSKLDGTVIPGELVFRLYDTYGFPADLTADIARERQLDIDMAGFDTAMERQRARARAASHFGAAVATLRSDAVTEFVGYATTMSGARIVELYVDGKPVDAIESGQDAMLVLDRTPFYAESGGQVGDTGRLTRGTTVGSTGGSTGRPAGGPAHFDVHDTRKAKQAFVHAGTLSSGRLATGDVVMAEVDADRRHAIRSHHSATHLLHGALRAVLGEHVEQRGSLVNDEHLRFDFSHEGAIGAEDQRAVERWIDREVRANHPCETIVTDMDTARGMGAMALFGEKYGNEVRVVKLGDNSVELCGGTHVTSTGDIGAVRLTSEGSVSSGIRRVEAVSGSAALAHAQTSDSTLQEVAELLKAPPTDVVAKVRQLQERARDLGRELEQAQARLSSSAGRDLAGNAENIGGVSVLLQTVADGDAKSLRGLVDRLRVEMPGGIVVLAGAKGGKAALLASVDKSLHDRVTAGELLGEVARALGGRGGGRPDLAQGGAPSLDGIDSAFGAARDWLAAALKDG